VANISDFWKSNAKNSTYTEGSLFSKNQKQITPFSKFFVALRENKSVERLKKLFKIG
jgi:hypothetical protein